MKRRAFIISSFSKSLSLIAASEFLPRMVSGAVETLRSSSKEKHFLVAGHCNAENLPKENTQHAISADVDAFACTMDLESREIKRFPVPIFAHSYNQHPVLMHLAVGVAKWTPTAIMLDLKTGQILRTLKAPGDFRFFGHAAFNGAGSLVFLTADSRTLQLGGICVYETSSGKLIKNIPTFCRAPHELIRSVNGEIMIASRVLDEDLASGVMEYFDAERMMPLRHHSLPGTEKIAHMFQLDHDNLLISGGSGDSRPEVYIFNCKSNRIKDIRNATGYPKEKILSEALSLAKVSDSEIAVTYSIAERVLIWNHVANKVQIMPIGHITYGLAEFNHTLFLNSGKLGHLIRFQKDNLKAFVQSKQFEDEIFANGRHMRLMSFT